MGYLFLCLSNISGLIKGFCGKIVSRSVKHTTDAMLANLIRMIFCAIIGLGVLWVAEGNPISAVNYNDLLITLISGISNAIFVIAWLFAVNYGAYMLVDVFLTMGIILPITLCSVFFGESIRLNHIIGFSILIVSVLVMCSYSSSVKQKLSPKAYLILFICGLTQGLSSFTQKWFIYTSDTGSIPSFNFFTYLFAAIILALSYLIFKKCEKNNEEKNGTSFSVKPILLYVTVMAIMLFLSSFFSTLAAKRLDAAVIYPLSTALGLILSSIMSSIFFGEKLTAKCITGLILAFVSIMTINLL